MRRIMTGTLLSALLPLAGFGTPHAAKAGGDPHRTGAFSTLLPLPQAGAPVESPSQSIRHAFTGVSRYEPAPGPVAMRPPPIRLTTAGKLWCMVRAIGGGCGPSQGGERLVPIANDPNTGGAIGAFGAAYQDASPVGHGIASNEAMPVGVK